MGQKNSQLTSQLNQEKVKKAELLRKIREIKENYSQALQKAQNKNSSLDLVPYEITQENEENVAQLNNSIGKNIGLIADHTCPVLVPHECPPCSLVHLDSHVCQPCNLEHCSHSDYQQLKEHVCPKVCSENYHQKIRLEREKEVLTKINGDCQLGCAADSNLEQVINKIKELISIPGGECLTAIIRLEKETMSELLSSSLFADYQEQLGQVGNYQELANHRSAILKKQLAEKNTQETTTVSPKSSLMQPKTILLGSLIITLLTAGGILVMKSRKNQATLPRKTETAPAIPSLQAINHYLRVNNIKSLEIDKQGRLITSFS